MVDGSESVCFRIMASFSNKLNFSPLFYKLYNVINYTNLNFLPPTIKQIRLSMIERFEAIPRPLFFCTSSKIVHEQCVNWLLVWSIWAIAQKNKLFNLHLNQKDKRLE